MHCVWAWANTPGMFKRPHHQRIAEVLAALDGALLREHHCLFGGGTAIALRFGEYRESVDMDFMVSNLDSYRKLRHLLTTTDGVAALVRTDVPPLTQSRELRADQYGIRTMLQVAGHAIKFEIILEGRIALDTPAAKDEICGVPLLTQLDMACSKLLANSDRWADDGVFNRDVIDLAMMHPRLPLLRRAVVKAEVAYGQSILRDLDKALRRLQDRRGWLERCMQVMAIDLPKAVVWQRLRALRKVLPT